MTATAWVLARKDLKLFLRDRTGLLLTLLLPVFLATIFAAAMGGFGGDGEIGAIELLVEDFDRTDRSRALVAALAGTDGLAVESTLDARRAIARGEAPAALRIASGYAADRDAGRAPQLTLYRDPGREIEQQVIAGALVAALASTAGRELVPGAIEESLEAFGFPAQARAEAQDVLERAVASLAMLALTASMRGDGAPADGGAPRTDERFELADLLPRICGVEIEDVAGGADPSRKAAGQSHAIAGIAVMMLLFGLTACGGTLLEEEAAGTLQRLQVSPAAGRTILAGKFLYTALIGMVQLATLFLFGGLVFDVPILRAPLALVALSLAVVAAATALGLLLAVLCRSRKQLEGLSTLVILVMSALGGSWFPLVITPGWYQRLGHLTLNAWAMDGYQGIFWYGKGVGGILPEIGVLLAIALVAAALATRGFGRRFAA